MHPEYSQNFPLFINLNNIGGQGWGGRNRDSTDTIIVVFLKLKGVKVHRTLTSRCNFFCIEFQKVFCFVTDVWLPVIAKFESDSAAL